MIGRTLGNYRIVEQIGMGGMATVYKAYDPDTDRYVALKTLPQQYSQDEAFRERFRREAKAIAKLEHIHILPVHAYGEAEGTAYMVMRYMKTGTLADRIRQGKLPLEETRRLLQQMADGLDYAHSQGIIHRDIKPSNILIDEQNNTYITDFGIAKMIEGSTLDLTGDNILGTPAYMSPEQCRGEKNLTAASDIYSLGVVLYEMVTGQTPFQAETPLAVIYMQLSEPLPMPKSLIPDLPEGVQNVILKALSKDPAMRYPTCNAMAQAFADAIKTASPVSTPKPEIVEHPTVKANYMPDTPTEQIQAAPTQVRRPDSVRKFPWWTLAGGVAALVVAALLFLSRGNNTSPESTQVAIVSTATTEATAETNPVSAPRESAAQSTLEATPAFYATQGAQFAESSDYEAAIEAYTDAIALAPDNAELYRQRAGAYQVIGEHEAAISDYQKITELEPQNARAYLELGLSRGYIGDEEQQQLALENFTQAIAIDPNEVEFYLRRAQIYYYYLHDNHAALTDLNDALELDEQNVDAYLGRGEYYAYEGEYLAAVEDYNKAIQYAEFPNYLAEGHWKRGQALLALDELDRAIADFTEALRVDDTPRNEHSYARVMAYRGRAKAYTMQESYADAVDDLTRALRLEPENSDIILQRGDVYTLMGDNVKALEDYNRAIELSPDYLDYYIQRGNLYMRIEDYDSAINDYTSAISLDSQNAELYILRGRAYRQQGVYQTALEDFAIAIELNPSDAQVYVDRGLAFRAAGDTEEAERSFKKAMENDPFLPSAYLELANMYYEGNQKEDALEMYRRYVEVMDEIGSSADPAIVDRIAELENE